MFKKIKNIISKKNKIKETNKHNNNLLDVDTGKLNLKPIVEKKFVKKGPKQLKVTKFNNKTQFYSMKLNNDEYLQLSVLGKKLVKENPELIKILTKEIFFSNRKTLKFFHKNVRVIVENIVEKKGLNHTNLYKLNFKSEGQNKDFFIKVSHSNFSANNEFLANQLFQRYGINTIKPHFAYTNMRTKRHIIVYDFSNLKLLSDAVDKKLLTLKEVSLIEKKINLLSENKELLISRGIGKKSIHDHNRFSNIFYEKTENGEIKIYFTDLLVGTFFPRY